MSKIEGTLRVRVVGILAFLVIAIVIWNAVVNLQFQPPPKDLPGGFQNRGMALQFVSDSSAVPQILGPEPSVNLPVMRKLILIDYLFIACYGLLFVTISLLLARRNCPWARYLGLLAVITGLMAAAFDVRENIQMLKVLDCLACNPEQIDVNSVNDAALMKWAMSFVTMGLLAIAFQDLANNLARWISISYIVTAAVGAVGLWRHDLLFVAFIPLVIGLGLLVFTAFVYPQKLAENRC